MLVFYSHFLWFIILFSMLSISLLFNFFLLYSFSSVSLSVDLFYLSSSPLSVSFYFDYVSVSFITIILLISTVIIIYSFNYMYPYSKSSYFLWLTFLFIASILIVVTISNAFFIMLGWDGLGLVSFFLIVYYQNQSSINSGLFTLLINRLGDCFFLVTLSLYFSLIGYSGFSFGSTFMVPLLPLFLVLTFMTNSAIFPFSPWLPLAMAAPTPISALVHSSTLVTSGLYLMIRYSYVIISSVHLVKTLVVLCIFTSFYAGLNSIFETDLNKLIALSTLSHLGFIGLSIFSGLINLGFFHMLTHALFKSLLFMAIGDIMINLSHSQDIRYLSSGYLFTPSSCSTIYVSILNLLGLPAMSGFFSKDLVLETLNYTNASFALISILFINVVFTFYYSYQLFFYSFQPAKVGPYSLIHNLEVFHSVLLLAMAVSSLFFGSFFLSAICHSVLFFSVPLALNLLPLFLSILIFLMLLVFGKQVSFSGRYVWGYYSSMINLSHVCMSLSSHFYVSFLSNVVKSVELGALSFTLNAQTSSFVLSNSALASNLSNNSPMAITALIFSFLLFCLMCV